MPLSRMKDVFWEEARIVAWEDGVEVEVTDVDVDVDVVVMEEDILICGFVVVDVVVEVREDVVVDVELLVRVRLLHAAMSRRITPLPPL